MPQFAAHDCWSIETISRYPFHMPPAGHRERLAALPDAQRREQAAALVMQLMAAMGLEEEGEEEGDEA